MQASNSFSKHKDIIDFAIHEQQLLKDFLTVDSSKAPFRSKAYLP